MCTVIASEESLCVGACYVATTATKERGGCVGEYVMCVIPCTRHTLIEWCGLIEWCALIEWCVLIEWCGLIERCGLIHVHVGEGAHICQTLQLSVVVPVRDSPRICSWPKSEAG